jgi:hypothetical protein
MEACATASCFSRLARASERLYRRAGPPRLPHLPPNVPLRALVLRRLEDPVGRSPLHQVTRATVVDPEEGRIATRLRRRISQVDAGRVDRRTNDTTTDRNSVGLPQPDGPMEAVIFPAGMSRFTPESARKRP